MIKLRRTKWATNTTFQWGNLKVGDLLEEVGGGSDRRTIIKWISPKILLDDEDWTDLIQGSVQW
jgi:hypothetical protein